MRPKAFLRICFIPQHIVEWKNVRRWRNGACIHRLDLLSISQNLPKLTGIFVKFVVAKLQFCQFSNVPNLISRQFHNCLAVWKRRWDRPQKNAVGNVHDASERSPQRRDFLSVPTAQCNQRYLLPQHARCCACCIVRYNLRLLHLAGSIKYAWQEYSRCRCWCQITSIHDNRMPLTEANPGGIQHTGSR